jgi:hypothetical protein
MDLERTAVGRLCDSTVQYSEESERIEAPPECKESQHQNWEQKNGPSEAMQSLTFQSPSVTIEVAGDTHHE